MSADTKIARNASKAMSMSIGARKGPAAEINVTPLIDVLLVLLIIFMVILPQHSLGENALIPQPNPDQVALNPNEPVLIQLKDPSLEINREQVRWDDLEARLAMAYSRGTERTAFVRGDPNIEFTYVAEAVDITHRAGAERIGLLGNGN
jgi:biopolymer transport protein TolR